MGTLLETKEQMLLQIKQQCWIFRTQKSPTLQGDNGRKRSSALLTSAAILRNPSTYLAKFAWKTRKKLIIPMATKGKIASAFYSLKIARGYNKAHLH
jgi:hypothetical protein